jgi:prephenate dehydrogenase
MKTVAIAGVGLIGGSFALAIRRAGFSGPILGVSSPSTIAEALSLGVITEGVSLAEACERADLVYLAQPILRIIEFLPKLAPYIRPGTLVTDAGSTKLEIVRAASHSLPPGSFQGGHPMAGKEVRGVAAADAKLFEGRPYVVTPESPEDLERPAVRGLISMIKAIGARPVILEPGEHDALVAYTSHLPQLLSTCLAFVLNGVGNSNMVIGPSVIDLTRLALSPYDMWQDIFATNRGAILQAIDLFTSQLQDVRNHLTSEATGKLFEEAAAKARKIREAN